MLPLVRGNTSRISSMGGPEHSKSGSKTPQLDNEQREADERGRVERCNSSPRHEGGEGVGGPNGNTDSGGGYGSVIWGTQSLFGGHSLELGHTVLMWGIQS